MIVEMPEIASYLVTIATGIYPAISFPILKLYI